MTNTCTLIIHDEVNIKFSGLDVATRRKLSDTVKYFMPHARHTPAYKLGRWDGMKRFCDIGGRSYFHLLDRLLPVVMDAGYEIKVEDHREVWDLALGSVSENDYSNHLWPAGHPMAGEPVILRDYQVNVINTFLNTPQGIQEIATGAGKTLITAVLSHKAERFGRTIVIVPNKDLVVQTERDYRNLGLDVGVLFGDRKEYTRTHTICTWQSLDILKEKTRNGEAVVDIGDFLKNVVCVMVDEVHNAKAEVLTELLSGVFSNVPIRWGLTGTIPKAEHEAVGCYCAIGPVIGELSSKELQDQGVLADLDIDIVQLQDGFMTFGSYAQELKWLLTDETRLDYISQTINGLAVDGNTLVLVDRIATGDALIARNPDWVFVSGGMKTTKRQDQYADISTMNNKVIVATYGVAAVGINIPRIFNLVLIEPGKSFVRVVQSIGRGIRKAEDKDYVKIVDITSNLKYSKRHATARREYYKEKEFRHKVLKVKYR